MRILFMIALLFTLNLATNAQLRQSKFEDELRPAVLTNYRESRPILLDRSTYYQYTALNDIRESVERVNGGWVQGRVFTFGGLHWPSVGMIDDHSVTYEEPVEGDNSDGVPFRYGWIVFATVDNWDGLIVSSSCGNWTQYEMYDQDFAMVRIVNVGNDLEYYLNDELVYSQTCRNLSALDLRAVYFNEVDEELIGRPQVTKNRARLHVKESLDFRRGVFDIRAIE